MLPEASVGTGVAAGVPETVIKKLPGALTGSKSLVAGGNAAGTNNELLLPSSVTPLPSVEVAVDDPSIDMDKSFALVETQTT